jgi:hypothetical protein
VGAFSVAPKEFNEPDEYFAAYKKIGVTAFSSSSVAYAFQVSTVYPFLLWGASNFYFIPIINTIFWGLGILLFYLCFDKYKAFIGKEITIHGFLGEHYGKHVRIAASYLTIIAFLGSAIGETYFGSQVLNSLMPDKNMLYAVICIALVFVFGYIAYGGQVSSIRTDQLQLIIAYTGIFGLMIYLVYLIISNGISVPTPLFAGFIVLGLYTLIILIFRRFRFVNIGENETLGSKIINTVLNTEIVTLFSAFVILTCIAVFKVKFFAPGNNFFNIEGFGWAGLLSLSLMPLCFQFVDLSNWQRLLSVKPDVSMSQESLHKNIKKGLLIYALESPFTWVIFIFFGLLTVTALPHFKFNDLLTDIPKALLASPNVVQNIFGYLFIVSILAIMLSTIDSFIVGILFTFVYDSYSKTRKILDSKDKLAIENNSKSIINSGRIFGFIAVLIGAAFFVFFDKKVPNGGVLFINLLLAFYAAQLSFFPNVIGALFLTKPVSPSWATISMLVGASLGVGVGLYSVIYKPEWAWYPILLCLGSAGGIYLIGLLFKKKD